MGVYLISIIIRAQCLENGIRDDLFVVPSKTKREVGANALKVELLHCRFDIGINKTVEVFEHSNLIGVNVVSEEVFKQVRMEHLLTLLKKVVAIFGDESNFIFDEYLKNGFRDALIWESVLEILVEDEVTFITENSNDFFEKGKQVLHPHLLEDLLRNNIDANQITVFKDLHSFVDTYVKPAMEKLDLESVRSDLSFGLGRYDKEVIADAILQALCSYDYGDEINPHKIGLPSEVEDIIVSYVEDLSDFHVVDAYKLSSGAWFIEAIALASYQFDFFILKADWYGMDEEAPLDVISSDWNDHYIYPPAFMPIHKTFTLTFTDSAGTVTCIEVNALASVLPYQK